MEYIGASRVALVCLKVLKRSLREGECCHNLLGLIPRPYVLFMSGLGILIMLLAHLPMSVTPNCSCMVY